MISYEIGLFMFVLKFLKLRNLLKVTSCIRFIQGEWILNTMREDKQTDPTENEKTFLGTRIDVAGGTKAFPFCALLLLLH